MLMNWNSCTLLGGGCHGMGEWATGSERHMAAGFLLGVMKALWNQIW